MERTPSSNFAASPSSWLPPHFSQYFISARSSLSPAPAPNCHRASDKYKNKENASAGVWEMNDGSSKTCAVNFMRNEDERTLRVERETENFLEANTKKVRREKFFSGNRFKKIYHTKIYSPSAHQPWQACEEYRIMGIHSTEQKR